MLGWTFYISVYGQMLCQENKVKQLEWVRQYADNAVNGFLNVVCTEKTSIQLESLCI